MKSLITVSFDPHCDSPAATLGQLSIQVVTVEAQEALRKMEDNILYLPGDPCEKRAVEVSRQIDLRHQQVQARILRSAIEGSEHPSILFGRSDDPFFPFEGRFHQSLSLLEQMAHSKVERILIQTRSPLVLLAMPILLGLRDRLTVRIGLEALTDADNESFTPALPRPSERIKAARALARLGIRTELQLSPLFNTEGEATSHTRDASRITTRVKMIAGLIHDLGTAARLVHLSALLPGEARQRMLRNPSFHHRIEQMASMFFEVLKEQTASVECRPSNASARICGEVAA